MKKLFNFEVKYLLMPFIYLFLVASIAVLILTTILSAEMSLVNMAFLDVKPNFSVDYKSIYQKVEKSNTPNIKANEITFPKFSEEFGELSIEGTKVKTRLFMGDDTKQLSKGVGLYSGSYIPGYGGMSLIAGHNNTHFKDLKSAAVGNKVNISTNYGNYVYEITSIKIAKDTDKSAFNLSLKDNSLALYTCYPFDSLGLKTERYYVYAKMTSGPVILQEE
jgi:sortase A